MKLRFGGVVLGLAGVVGAVIVAGCGAAAQPVGPGMMGGTASSGSTGGNGSGGYSYSRLACAAPGALPGRTVTVVLADMGMTSMMGGTAPVGLRMMLRATPASVPAGTISVVAQNRGWRTHELVILPLAAGQQAGQRVPGADGKVAETGSVGEASASCQSGAADGITAASVGWATVTLPAGRYELVCNLPNHYADGMHQELDVTGS